ncbi:glutamate-rich protein 3 [Periophthalmus magnuspinnatus]|uniref:glutamate-rich protein 3 n=1 Tax=Periophthalmus magnuspinnatus TaxID=409849 RepID=UPI002436B566|nr:glutamate-rich protein 3 [Periophthalmus magnuspinnatus]
MSHSHLNPGLISAYNSLTDKHLAGYFSNTRIRRHLQRAGLITRSGRIVPDKEYRQKLIQKAHQRHVRECLAQAIFHKVLEMERLHQIEIKRKLEEFARRERVHKIKVERPKRFEEDIIRILSPRPPTGGRGIRKQHSGPEAEHTESSESPGSSRPNTAPGKMQRPVRLKPLHSNSTTASHRHSSPYRSHAPHHDNQRQFNGTVDKDSHRRLNSMEVRNGVSPYCLPVINNYVTPVPPSTKRKERPVKLSTSSTHRGRRLRPTTTSSGPDVSEDPPVLRSSVPQSRVCVNMVYLGKSVHLSHDLPDMRDEVRVFQQHCGGENLCVFKGKLREGESFQFISRRHRGFPFSLTFFLNGLQVERLSSCCEFKHRKSSRLGGRHGHFAFSGIEAASPCYKCIIAMGLDKKPVPPPKRAKEDAFRVGIVPRLTVTVGTDTEVTKEDPVSRSECETSPRRDTEITAEEDKAPEDSKTRDDYEEDFEADDEGPVEEEKEKKATSPNEEKEEKVKETNASDSENSERDDDRKSCSGSSFSGSDKEESEAEEVKEAKEEGQDKPEDEVQEEVQEETQQVESGSAEVKDCEIQDSAGQSTEIEITDTSAPSGNETREMNDTRTTAEGERRTEEEPERAKSVQEKLAEAILKESQCSSEPELSDTSTETTEVGSNKSTDKQAKVAETVTGQPDVTEGEKKTDVRMMEEEVKPEGETTKEPEEILEADTVQTDNTNDKAASETGKDEDTGEKEASEEIVENVKSSSIQDELNKEAEKDVEDREQEERSIQKEDESSGVDKPDETAVADNTEPMVVTETMEMKAEASDTQEAINTDVAPASDTQANNNEQDAMENTGQESEVNVKDETISQDGKEESVVENEEIEKVVEVTIEMEEDKVKKQSDLNEGDKDKMQKEGDAVKMGESPRENVSDDATAEKVGTNSNSDGQDNDEEVKTEKNDLEDHKLERELIKEEKDQETKEILSDLNTDQKGHDNKAPTEEDASGKPKEELEKAEADEIQNGGTSKEKSVSEDEKNTAQNEEEVQHTESEVRNDTDKKQDKVKNEESVIQKDEEKEPNVEDSVKVTEQNVKSDEGATVEESDKPENGNKSISNEVDVSKVDAENGEEMSVIAETKQTDEDEQKRATENADQERDGVTQVEESEKEKKSELKQENDNNGSNIENASSILSNQEDTVKPTSKDSDTAENNNNLETAQSNSDKPTGEEVAAVDVFAVEGENGDTEEASKASEGGVSVLLKPQAKSSLNGQNEQNEKKGSPEGLTTADSADLVTNWVTMHQTSKYFETFVEPLEEIRDVNSETTNTQSEELPRCESPVKMVKDGEKDNSTENETKEDTSDRGSNQSGSKQGVSTKDMAQEVKESKVIHVPNVENEENTKESVIEESLNSVEDKIDQSASEVERIHDSFAQLNNNLTRTSITSSHLSIPSGKHEIVSESLNEEKESDHGKEEVTIIQKDKTEELPENSDFLKTTEPATSEDAQENSKSKKVTVTTHFTSSKSDSGSQQGSIKQTNSISENKTEVMEESSNHTVSKEHLSTFSVDDSVFGHSSFHLVTTTKAENGH